MRRLIPLLSWNAKPHRSTLRPRATPPGLERLEHRDLPAVTISVSDASAVEGSSLAKVIDIPIGAATSPIAAPKGITRGPNGDYFVTSSQSNAVLRYDGVTFAYLGVFVTSGSGGLSNAIDLVFGNGDLYISSANTDSVLRYDGQTGAFLGEIVSSGAFGIDRPTDLVVRDGMLYVGAFSGDVHRYDLATGTFVDMFVATGSGGLTTPSGITFGPDGHLYVAEYELNGNNAILRYDGVTGAFLGEFIPENTGGLNRPAGIEFGPDGDLYVLDFETDRVLRFDGTTGAFLDVFVTAGLGGLDLPTRALFADGLLLVISQATNQIHRFGPSSLATLTVSLSAASTVPVTVSYSTANGTAAAGSDYAAASDTLTFAPGETSRTVLISTLDDITGEPSESFVVNLSSPVGATILDGQGVATILDDDATKFFVVDDASADRTYRYGQPGNSLGNSTLTGGNTTPRGVASTATGDKYWVVDANKTVYVYNAGGGFLGSWSAGGLNAQAQVEGIATNGTDVWLLDNKQDKVFKYTGAASRLSGSQNAASSFNLSNGNSSGKGIVTDGASFWVVNDGTTDKVFKYTLAGTLLGSWTIDAANASPTGLTINPASVSDIWVVDSGTDRVYQYTASAGRTSGSQSATATFALAAGNTNPQDIADPPPPDMDLTPSATSRALMQPSTTAFTVAASSGAPVVAALPPLADRDAVFATLAREAFRVPGAPGFNLPSGTALTPPLSIPTLVAGVAPGGQAPMDQPAPLTRGNSQRTRPERALPSPLNASIAEGESQAVEMAASSFSTETAEGVPAEE